MIIFLVITGIDLHVESKLSQKSSCKMQITESY